MPTAPETIRTKARRDAERAAAVANAEPSETMTVVLHGLRADALIGVYPHEHDVRQPIEIDVEATIDGAVSQGGDRLSATFDYDAIAQAVLRLTGDRHTKLVETLAGNIADWCFTDARVLGVTVRIRKPNARTDCAWAGCVLTRHRGQP